MFTVFYIIVALLQFTLGQESVHYESEIPNEVDTNNPNEYTGKDFTRYIEHTEHTVEDNNDSKTNDDVPISDEHKDENIEDSIESITVVYADPEEQGKITVTSYDADAETTTVAEPISEEIETNEVVEVDEAISTNTVAVSGPVKAGGKVTVIANFGCEDNNNFTSSEEVPKAIEPISFSGCANAQGKVTIAAHFGCGENTGNVVTLPEKDGKVPVDMSDGSVSFGGPVHAEGKVIVGSHYGCGAPIGIYQSPLPWFPTFFHPKIYYPPPMPVFTAQYPYPILETRPFTVFHGLANEPGNFEDLPVISNLANSKTGDLHNGKPFSGVVPAAGTVSIAARF